MRKFLLLGTMLGVAGTALAFGGVFSHGSKSSTYKGGVNAIGVHIGGEGSANITTNCPEHSSKSDDSPECMCESGYEMTDSACKPIWPSTCAANNLYWCPNSQTCVENKNACLALCPEDRLCANGTTCCGQGNTCVDGNKCCRFDADGEATHCCSADNSTGTSGWGEDCCSGDNTSYGYEFDGILSYNRCCPNNQLLINLGNISTCCAEGEIGYIVNYNNDGAATGACCNGTVHIAWEDEDGYEQFCCPKGNSLMEMPIGLPENRELQTICCSGEKIYCDESDIENNQPVCYWYACCDNGEVVEQNGHQFCLE